MKLNTEHFARCIQTLESSYCRFQAAETDSIEQEVFRNAVVKCFELTLETAGKLLRKVLKAYTGQPRAVDALTYKDLLREAARHALLTTGAVTRWFSYRDNRNNTAHDYGIGFAEETLLLLPAFMEDARALEREIQTRFGDDHA